MTLIPGTRLGPYEILAPLGAGGMGEVYRARDPKLNRDVAIKILPEALAADPVALARFEREAQAVAALSHPNILAIFDFGRQGDTAYAVMELLEGETLHARRAHGAPPARKALELAVQIAEGLAAAHEKGIVHRDLKPENIFITHDGRPKVLDFGLAKRTGAANPACEDVRTTGGQTGPGLVLGTAGYMSPEQVRGEAVNPRSDIFSFGVVLYEMLTGRQAFARDTTAESMTAILLEYPAGHLLYETTGYISHPRVSPSGDAVAFLDHPIYDDNRGTVALVTTSGEKKTLTREWGTETGLAWSPGGDEIWFTAADSERVPLAAVTRAGKVREVWSALSGVSVLDVAPDGRVLVTPDTERMESYSIGPGDASERDISWMSLSVAKSVAADARSVLFTRYDEGAGRDYEVGVRRLDAPSAVRLGTGEAVQLSPDGTSALAIVYSVPSQLLVFPTGAGESRSLTVAGFNYLGAGWYPDGRRLIFVAEQKGQPLSAYVQGAAGGAPTRLGVDLGPLGSPVHSWRSLLVSPDGRWFTGRAGPPTLVSIEGSQPRSLANLGDTDSPVGWTADGRGLFVNRPGSTEGAVQIVRVDVASGAIELWKEIMPPRSWRWHFNCLGLSLRRADGATRRHDGRPGPLSLAFPTRATR